MGDREQPNQPSHQAVKVVTAMTIGGGFLVLSGLTLAGTVLALTVATPVLVVFSPVLLPAAVAVFLLALGFLSSGGFAAVAVSVLDWAYRHATGERSPGTETAKATLIPLAGRASEVKDRPEQFARMVLKKVQEAALQ